VLSRIWTACHQNSILVADLLAANCVFFIPLSYTAPPLPIFPLEFRGEVKRQETRVMGLLCGEGCMILTSTVFD